MPDIFQRCLTYTAPANAPTSTGIVGGSATNPTTPINGVVIATGFSQVYTADRTGRYHFYINGNNDLMRWDSQTGVLITAATHAQLGAVIKFLVASNDGSLFAFTTNYNILHLVNNGTAYLPTLLAGSGATGSADGVGSAASFGACTGIDIDPVTFAFLIFYDGSIGGARKITISTGAVQTLYRDQGSFIAGGFALDTGGNMSLGYAGGWFERNIYNGTNYGNVDVSGQYFYPVAFDSFQPMSRYAYFCQSGAQTTLFRVDTRTSGERPVTTIGTGPAAFNNGGNNGQFMCYRSPAVYVVDTAGNLVKFVG